MTLKSLFQSQRRELTLNELLENNTWKSREHGHIHVITAAFKVIKTVKSELDESAAANIKQAFEALRMITHAYPDLSLADYMVYERLSSNDELFKLMPKPQQDALPYKRLYFTIEAMIKGNILAHRMSISGSGKVNGGYYAYSGSYRKRMIEQMQRSVQSFFTDNTEVLKIIGQFRLSSDVVSKALEDLQSVSIEYDEQCQQHIEKDLPVFLCVGTQSIESHVIAVVLGKDFCMVADRGNLKSSGISVFTGSANSAVRKRMAQSLLDPSIKRTFEEVFAVLSIHYDVSERVDYYPLSLQIGHNCTWLCAKMMVFMAFYCHAKSNLLAKQCTHLWSLDDKLTQLQDYLSYYATEHMIEFGPDKLLLAKIYLTTKDDGLNQRKIRTLLEQSGFLTAEVLRAAYASLLEDVQVNLDLMCLQSNGQAMPHEDEVCKLIADLFTTSPKKEFQKIVENILSNASKKGFLASLKSSCELKYAEGKKKWYPSQGIEPLIAKFPKHKNALGNQ